MKERKKRKKDGKMERRKEKKKEGIKRMGREKERKLWKKERRKENHGRLEHVKKQCVLSLNFNLS